MSETLKDEKQRAYFLTLVVIYGYSILFITVADVNYLRCSIVWTSSDHFCETVAP